MSNRLSTLQLENVGSLSRNTVDRCIDRLLEGAVVVVPSQRLKHLIEDGYNRAKLDQGETTWPTAKVYVWHVWLSQLWADLNHHSGNTSAQLLTSAQSMQIWERAIAEDIKNEYRDEFEYLLWHITATANRARSAYGLMRGYGIEHTQFGDGISQDVAHFLRWLETYLRHLDRTNLIDFESLPDALCRRAREIGDLRLEKLVFSGFIVWTVQHQKLLDSLSEIAEVERLEHKKGGTPRRLDQIEFEKVDDEIDLCARWARSVIEADPKNHRVGIVAPRLDSLYGRILRRFSATLNPDKVMDQRELQNLSFHVTLGTALIDTPLVVDALNLLELMQSEVDVSILCSVIQSDRVRGWDIERSQRAKLKNLILMNGHNQLSLEHVEKLIESDNLRCSQLSGILARARQMLSEMPKFADYAYWGSFLMDWMKNFQSETRENREFGNSEKQAHESLSSAIESLAELGFVSSKVGVATAVAKLRRTLAEVSVQPRAVRVPVQIGDMNTIAGQSFTHLWMLAMNNADLPGSPRPNPFIPVSLQKQVGIPESSASLLEKSVTERIDLLLSSAVDVVQSYAVIDGNAYHQPSSHLQNLRKIDSLDLTEIGEYPDYRQRISQERHVCQRFVDWKASEVDNPADIRGGSSLLKNQSLCPFRAFAQHRLYATQAESAGIGISAIERGLLAHRMFEGIYSEITSSDQICDEEKYLEVARKYAEQAMAEFICEKIKSINNDLAEGEVERMVDLARQWLIKERGRKDFNVVGTEKDVEVGFSDLKVRLKIDRIDQDHRGAVIIDYKTGQCSTRDMDGVRPKDPQLLIYLCAMEQQNIRVAEVAYARIKRGSVSFMSRDVSTEDIAELETRIEEIADGFLDGKADVDPLPGACDYCHLEPICRKDDRSDHVLESESNTT